MEKKIDIAIVDDHELFRDGLKLVISQIEDFNVCNESSGGKEFLAYISHGTYPDVVLMDVNMPEMNGIETTEKALKIAPGLKVIALTMHKDESYYMQMISAGAKGFVLKKSGKYELQQAINEVYSGGNYFSSDIMQKMTFRLINPHTDDDKLTKREKEILKLICNGLSSNEISEKLFISPKTVEVHRTNIFRKTNVKNTARLVIWAVKNNIYSIE
jgi:DNA-binding NarL/FixJ family response regulator